MSQKLRNPQPLWNLLFDDSHQGHSSLPDPGLVFTEHQHQGLQEISSIPHDPHGGPDYPQLETQKQIHDHQQPNDHNQIQGEYKG
jgi:hypothetical protein